MKYVFCMNTCIQTKSLSLRGDQKEIQSDIPIAAGMLSSIILGRKAVFDPQYLHVRII